MKVRDEPEAATVTAAAEVCFLQNRKPTCGSTSLPEAALNYKLLLIYSTWRRRKQKASVNNLTKETGAWLSHNLGTVVFLKDAAIVENQKTSDLQQLQVRSSAWWGLIKPPQWLSLHQSSSSKDTDLWLSQGFVDPTYSSTVHRHDV